MNVRNKCGIVFEPLLPHQTEKTQRAWCIAILKHTAHSKQRHSQISVISVWHQGFVCHPTFVDFIRQMWGGPHIYKLFIIWKEIIQRHRCPMSHLYLQIYRNHVHTCVYPSVQLSVCCICFSFPTIDRHTRQMWDGSQTTIATSWWSKHSAHDSSPSWISTARLIKQRHSECDIKGLFAIPHLSNLSLNCGMCCNVTFVVLTPSYVRRLFLHITSTCMLVPSIDPFNWLSDFQTWDWKKFQKINKKNK